MLKMRILNQNFKLSNLIIISLNSKRILPDSGLKLKMLRILSLPLRPKPLLTTRFKMILLRKKLMNSKMPFKKLRREILGRV
jgi:hypothetical protein